MNFTALHYRRRANFVLVIVLLLHIPALCAVAAHFGTGITIAIGYSIAILSAPALCLALQPSGRTASIALGIASMCFSSLLIHLSRGMIEMHFHIFVVLAALIALGDWIVIVAAAVTIAVHHTTFFFLLPASVFNYNATFSVVLTHACFVVLSAVPSALISRKFHQFIIAQEMVSSRLAGFTSLVTQSSRQLNSTSRHLARAATEQTESLQDAASSLTEIAASTALAARNVERAAQLAAQSHGGAEHGAAEMQEMNSAMLDVQNAGDEIAKIIKTIDDIAFQTNLLALNAAVEAARAGDSGLGFAVVADEVRNLAQRSAEAARETAARIEKSVSNSRHAAEMTTRVRSRFGDILIQVREVRDLVSSIATGANEQSIGISRLSETVQTLEQTTEANASDANIAAAAAAHLADHAASLQQTVTDLQAIVGGEPADEAPLALSDVAEHAHEQPRPRRVETLQPA